MAKKVTKKSRLMLPPSIDEGEYEKLSTSDKVTAERSTQDQDPLELEGINTSIEEGIKTTSAKALKPEVNCCIVS